jgi:phospholipase/carboxylesterase
MSLELFEDLPLQYRLRPAKGVAKGLVILLHGVGSNESGLIPLAAQLPEELDVALVRSPIAMGPSAYCAFRVNFTNAGPVIDAPAAEASRQLLAQFITQLQARLSIAPEKTIVAGFSQGGIMSAGLALTEPQLVRGFAIISGRILPEIAPLIKEGDGLKHLSALILHGTQDGTLPATWADKSALWLRALGVNFVDKRYQAQHEITPQMANDFVVWVSTTLGIDLPNE